MSKRSRYPLSLLLNGVLILAVGMLALYRTAGETGPAAGSIRSATTSLPPVSVRRPEPPRYTGISSGSERRRTIIDRLRAKGVPDEILARVALVDFEAQWDERFDACKGDMAKAAAVQLAMQKSKDAEMTAALGEESFRKWDQAYMLWEAMSTPVAVNAVETEAIYGLKKTLQRRNLELEEARLNGTLAEAEISKGYDQAYSDYYRQLNALLGDERYAKSQQLDDAFTGDNLRYRLAAARPGEAQFQELFKMEKESEKVRLELDHRFQNNPTAPEYLAQIKDLNDAKNRDYQRVLGAEAVALLQKLQDPAYSQMKKYQKLWGLDGEKIDYIYDTMKTYEESVEVYKGDILARQKSGQSIDWEAVNRNLGQFAEQTRQTLRSRLGQASFDKLQGNRVLKFVQVQKRPDQTASPNG